MDFFKFSRWAIKKMKLVLLYFRRILFAKNHFKCPFYKKIRANLSGGFLADQWMLYDFDHNDRHEYLSEFDWYRSRYINEPFDFVCNNKIASAEILKQYVRVPESYMIKNRGFLSSFQSVAMEYEDALTLLKEKGSYFFKPYSIYFDAKEKKYLPNLIYQIGLLVKTISEIALLFIGFDLIKILIVSLCIMIITNFAVKHAMKKQFPEVDLKVEKDYSAWKGTKHLIVHKLGGVVANNVDMIMISTFTGLAKVVVYSSYMYVINAIKTLLSKFSSSLYSLVGIKMLGDSEKENYKVFLELNSLMSFVSIVICASLIFAINPFIDIFYEGEVVTSKLLAFCFILMLFLSINSSTLYVYTNSTGLFKETKICTIVEAISNLVLSAIGMILLGIPGIVLATSISYIIADYIIKPRVLYKNVFKKESKKDFYKNFIIVSITFILFLLFLSILVLDSYLPI